MSSPCRRPYLEFFAEIIFGHVVGYNDGGTQHLLVFVGITDAAFATRARDDRLEWHGWHRTISIVTDFKSKTTNLCSLDSVDRAPCEYPECCLSSSADMALGIRRNSRLNGGSSMSAALLNVEGRLFDEQVTRDSDQGCLLVDDDRWASSDDTSRL